MEHVRFIPEEVLTRSPLRLVDYDKPLLVTEKREAMPQLQTYTLEFDIDAYQQLQAVKDRNLEEFTKMKEALDATTSFNVVTTLAERLNAAVSRRVDLIDEQGIMRDAFQQRPLIEWYEQGRLARLEQGSSAHDQLRERAEIVGQEKIQAFFAQAPVGALAFFLSRPGTEFQSDGDESSIYKHNFIDISYKSGEQELSVMRCMSNLPLEEALAKVKILKPQHEFSDQVSDLELLENPIEILPEESFIADPDELHDYLHSSLTDSFSEEEFELVKNACLPYIRRYLLVVEDATFATNSLKRAFNAILNKADEVARIIKSGDGEKLIYLTSDTGKTASNADIYSLGLQPVRMVDTGCGFSGGFAAGYSSPLSVLDFGGFQQRAESDQYGPLHFDCPACKKINKRPRNSLIPNCQFCGSDVRCETENPAAKKKEQQRHEAARREAEEKKLSQREDIQRKPKEESFWEVIFSAKKS